jgi:nicotinic acid mononucleotide adenylyltransferase
MLDNPGAGEPKTPSFEVFDPHLLLARCSKEQFKLHEIIFVLPKTLPNKPVIDTSIEQRLEMNNLCAAQNPA